MSINTMMETTYLILIFLNEYFILRISITNVIKHLIDVYIIDIYVFFIDNYLHSVFLIKI